LVGEGEGLEEGGGRRIPGGSQEPCGKPSFFGGGTLVFPPLLLVLNDILFTYTLRYKGLERLHISIHVRETGSNPIYSLGRRGISKTESMSFLSVTYKKKHDINQNVIHCPQV
jgi:hypothetical protein